MQHEPAALDTDDDAPMVIDALNQDAAPREYPKDAPGLWPYLKLPFRERAKFFKVYRELVSRQGEVSDIEKKARKGRKLNETQMLEQAASLYELYALMDDLMLIAAVDKDAYRAWVDSHDDEKFAELFAAYVERSQPGEASSSERS
jgi:hypothetical protein